MENALPNAPLIKSSSSVKLSVWNGLWSVLLLGGTLFAINTQLDLAPNRGSFN